MSCSLKSYNNCYCYEVLREQSVDKYKSLSEIIVCW